LLTPRAALRGGSKTSNNLGQAGYGLGAVQDDPAEDTRLQYVDAVPERFTWAMMILGFAGLGFMALSSEGKASIDGGLTGGHRT